MTKKSRKHFYILCGRMFVATAKISRAIASTIIFTYFIGFKNEVLRIKNYSRFAAIKK